MTWKLTLHGNSDHVEDEHGFVALWREFVGKLNNNGRPSGVESDNVVHAQFEGSHTGVHNLLSNPEPEPEEVKEAPAPESKGNPLTLDSVSGQQSEPPAPKDEEEPANVGGSF